MYGTGTSTKAKTATLTPSGVKKAEAYFNIDNLTDADNITIQQTTVDESPSVTVTVQAPIKTQGAFFSNLAWAGLLQGSDLKTMKATYTMYDENQQK